MNSALKVMLWDMEVGRIYWDSQSQRSVFNYNPDFVRRGLDIAPLCASIHKEYGKDVPFISDTLKEEPLYKGLPPFLADSLPEKWGTALFDCWAKEQGLNLSEMNPVARLSFIGRRAMGAFEFIPDIYPWNNVKDIHLGELYELADRIYRMRENVVLFKEDQTLLSGLCELGSSVGGQQSKAVIAIHKSTGEIRSGQIILPKDYTYYILKFADGLDFPKCNIEMAYHLMAKDAGIDMMPCKLIEIEGKSHFLTERFDRQNGEKIHMQTAAALLPGMESYEDLFFICHHLQISYKEREELFRRTVFNLFSGNTDDHTRNFSFMMDKTGKWHITPAYDLTFTTDLGNTVYGDMHSIHLCGKDNHYTVEDLMKFAKAQGIKSAKQIISTVLTTISNWREYAQRADVNNFAIDKIEKHLASILPLEYARTMTHYKGEELQAYTTENNDYVSEFRMNETSMHDYELWAIINGTRYRAIVDGETIAGQEIRDKGGVHMPLDHKKKLIEIYLIPKATAKKERMLLAAIKDVKINADRTLINCRTINGWLQEKTIKLEDLNFEDEYELALKYFKDEIMNPIKSSSSRKI